MRDLIELIENGAAPALGRAGNSLLRLLEADLARDKAARLDRARAAGFDTGTVYYHGTGVAFARFSTKSHGSAMGAHNREPYAVWLTTSPEVAGVYASHDPSQTPWLGDEADRPKSRPLSPNLMPLYARLRKPDVHDCSDLNHYQLLRNKGWWLERAKDGGSDGVIFRNAEDGSDHRSNIVAVFNPRNVRSVFANFDPAATKSTDLMA